MNRLSNALTTDKCDYCPIGKIGECQFCSTYVCGLCCQNGTPEIAGSFVCNPCFWHYHFGGFYFD